MNRLLVCLASVLHLVPHPFSVTPVAALALYGGALGRARSSWAVPLVPVSIALLISGLYSPIILVSVVVGLILTTRIGRYFLASERGYGRYAAAIVAAASLFFLLTNTAVWLAGYYPPTVAGLLQCYLAGLPFLLQATLADAAFCCVLFGLHTFIEREAPSPVTA